MKYLNALLVLVLCVAMAACDDEMKFMAEGDPMQISVNATTKYSGAQSRAVLGNEVEITGYTFLYYVKKDGNLTLSNKTYSTESGFSVVIECPGTESNLAILIANAPKDAFDNLALGSNISELNNYAQDWTHTYNNPPLAKDFTWSGFQYVAKDTRTLGFTLNPNVAKVTLTIDDQTGTSELKNIRLKRIRDKVRYAQKALYETGYCNESELEVSERGYFSYDMEDMNVSKNEDGSYSWYVPHNEPYIAAGDKNDYSRETGLVPSGSTFIEIDDQLTTSTNLATSYRLYPGISEKDDYGNYKKYSDLSNFKVIADYQYNFIVTITENGLGIEQTTNLEFSSGSAIANTSYKVKLPEKNNCYMIHPRIQFLNTSIMDNGAYKVKSVWEMPVHERINEYWKNETGADAIDDNTEWQAEVIWQDIKGRAFHFTDEYAATKKDVFNGLGKNPVYFMLDSERLKNTMSGSLTDDTDIYGNILIGVKKKGSSEYLWSWHLWVTDYNPDAAPAYTEGLLYYKGISGNTSMGPIDMQGKYYYDAADASYTEKLFDGNVQHYNSLTSFWTSKTPTATDVPSYPSSSTVWDSGLYAKKWIMDRNIGAQSPDNSSIENPDEAYGLYYQYGRKDPFSYKPIYDIDGTPKASKWSTEDAASSEGGLIKKGIQNPQKFFTTVGKTIKWDKTASDNDWFNPEWNHTETRGDKTLFDPCPPGWCIPVHEVFSFAVATTSNKGLDDVASVSTTHSTVEVNINNTSASNNSPIISDPLRGFCDLICTIADDDCKARYPLAGYIDGNSSGVAGSITGFTTTSTAYATAINVIRGCLWTLEHDNDGSAKLIQIQPTSEGLGGTTAVTYPISKRGRYYKVHYARLAIREWVTSRGQNVRCIQEP